MRRSGPSRGAAEHRVTRPIVGLPWSNEIAGDCTVQFIKVYNGSLTETEMNSHYGALRVFAAGPLPN